jgi:hypothetical protein
MTTRLKSDGSDGMKVIDRKGKNSRQFAYTVDKGHSVTSVTLPLQLRGRSGGSFGSGTLVCRTDADCPKVALIQISRARKREADRNQTET